MLEAHITSVPQETVDRMMAAINASDQPTRDVVTERTVRRWYYRGKGYGSKISAYKAMAKEALLTEVFGPRERVVGDFSTYETRRGFIEIDTAIEHSDTHSANDCNSMSKRMFAEKMRAFGFTCDNSPRPWHECPETFGFCGPAYKAWILAKARQLMKADGL